MSLSIKTSKGNSDKGVQNGSRRYLPVLCINSNEIEKL